MNARFIVYHNGQFTKLTIKPGERLRFSSGGPTEEGYSYKYEEFYYPKDENKVYCTVHCESLDCDGPYQRTWTGYFHVDREFLDKSRDEYGNLNRHCPTWIKEDEYQRDVYAEMMGY